MEREGIPACRVALTTRRLPIVSVRTIGSCQCLHTTQRTSRRSRLYSLRSEWHGRGTLRRWRKPERFCRGCAGYIEDTNTDAKPGAGSLQAILGTKGTRGTAKNLQRLVACRATRSHGTQKGPASPLQVPRAFQPQVGRPWSLPATDPPSFSAPPSPGLCWAAGPPLHAFWRPPRSTLYNNPDNAPRAQESVSGILGLPLDFRASCSCPWPVPPPSCRCPPSSERLDQSSLLFLACGIHNHWQVAIQQARDASPHHYVPSTTKSKPRPSRRRLVAGR